MEPFAQRIILGKRNVQIRGERRQCLRKLERGDFAWGRKSAGTSAGKNGSHESH